MKEACIRNNLQPKNIFLEKCIQLYETIMVRHGLMVVGDPYAGKSSVIKVLSEAMSAIKGDPKFVNVMKYYINPKAVTQNQLYGVFNLDTQEWSDGILAIRIRDCAESETDDRKWIIFDGPVDAVWIENMNTVLDDNKKLCLTSGAIIKLKPTMTIMFQVDDLSQASPATISRCGMVLLESGQLGHSVFIESFKKDLMDIINEEKICEKFEKLFHYVVDLSVEYTRVNCKFPCAGTSSFIVNHMIRIIDTFLKPYKPRGEDEDPVVIPGDIEEKLNNFLLFAAIWGIGGVLDEFTRDKFDIFLQDLMNGEDVRDKYKVDLGKDGAEKYPATKVPNKIGEFKSLFDLSFDQEEMKWTNWMNTVDKYQVDKDLTFLQLSIPTIDTIRMLSLCKMLLMNNKHCLLVGPTGTGKSLQLNSLLKSDFDNETWAYYQLGFSAQTTSNQTERIIDGSMDKKRKGVFGPKLNKEGIIFVDDLNMPQKEKYGAQPPIELLRQWMDYKGWYDIDTPEKDFRKLEKVRFAGAMGPPGDGRNSISSRYIRHFNVLYIEPYKNDSLEFIFSTVMDWMFAGA
jgi:dynein heavy chain